MIRRALRQWRRHAWIFRSSLARDLYDNDNSYVGQSLLLCGRYLLQLAWLGLLLSLLLSIGVIRMAVLLSVPVGLIVALLYWLAAMGA